MQTLEDKLRDATATALETLITPTISAMGYQLWGCLYIPQGRHAILRVYIDSEDGIKITDCERVSRQLSALLDVEDPIRGTYTLEVSSPGIDRPLFKLAHFQRFMGERVDIRLQVPIENRRHLKGIVMSVVDEQHILVKLEDREITVALNNIAKAKLVPSKII